MKLELNDILDRVARTERQRAGYNMMADAWEAMWNLEAFDETREAALRITVSRLSCRNPTTW